MVQSEEIPRTAHRGRIHPAVIPLTVHREELLLTETLPTAHRGRILRMETHRVAWVPTVAAALTVEGRHAAARTAAVVDIPDTVRHRTALRRIVRRRAAGEVPTAQAVAVRTSPKVIQVVTRTADLLADKAASSPGRLFLFV